MNCSCNKLAASSAAASPFIAGNPRRNASFSRSLAEGKLNLDWMFPYPTLSSREQLDETRMLCDSIQKFFEERVDSAKVDSDAKISPDVMKELQDMGLFGLQIPAEYGGLELNHLQHAYILQEVSRDSSVYIILAHHQMAVQAILTHGSEEQKKKYLPKLAAGELLATFCFSESTDGLDVQNIRTRAEQNRGDDDFVLNGVKPMVTSGLSAQLFIVYAKTPVVDVKNEVVDKLTAFIVERNFDGVRSGDLKDKIGMRASETCALVFDDVKVPLSNVLGQVGGGHKVAMQVMNKSRYLNGSYSSGILKRLVAPTCEHALSRQQFGQQLSEFGLVKQKLTQVTSDAYVIESATFMVAGQLDRIDESGGELEHDCHVEAAMLKIYSSEATWKHTSECLQVFGGLGYMKEYPYERQLRDSAVPLVFEGPNYLLKMYVALTTLNLARTHHKFASLDPAVRSKVEKSRGRYNRLVGSNVINMPWKRKPVMAKRGYDVSARFLESELFYCGDLLEECVDSYYSRLYYYMKNRGKTLMKNDLLLQMFVDMQTKIFMMSAVLARCNKSIIFQAGNHEMELEVTRYFIDKSFREVNMLLEDMHEIPRLFHRDLVARVTRKTLRERDNIFTHPVEHRHLYKDHPVYLAALKEISDVPTTTNNTAAADN